MKAEESNSKSGETSSGREGEKEPNCETENQGHMSQREAQEAKWKETWNNSREMRWLLSTLAQS